MTNIILAGFMAAGKSTIGREAARRLAWQFVDTDELVETAANMPIPVIFAQRGESAFRQQERMAVERVVSLSEAVIAVGGGALLDATNRARLEASGVLVCLDADEETTLERLGAAAGRPLLAGGNPQERIRALRSARAAHYASLPIHIDTTGKEISQVVEEVIAVYRGSQAGTMGTTLSHAPTVIQVPVPGSEYQVEVGPGLLSSVGQRLRGLGLELSDHVVVVTQPALRHPHADRLMAGFMDAQIRADVVDMPDGESYKTLATVAALYEEFVRLRVERSSTIVALGGGVVGDVAGFTAATYLRGLPFVQVPTSLLAMVDSSVGGKTGVDLPAGKNLVGAFHQPRRVLCDTDVLATLPAIELRCGLAEVVKSAIIGDAGLFETLELASESGRGWPLAEIVRRSVAVKAAVVAADPTEWGARATLNLGHTIGHGIEQASGYRYRHGEAVSIGLVGATRLAVRLGLCDRAVSERTERLLKAMGLPTAYQGLQPESVSAAMQTDKKRRQGKLRWALPVRIGEVTITDDVPSFAVEETIRSLAVS